MHLHTEASLSHMSQEIAQVGSLLKIDGRGMEENFLSFFNHAKQAISDIETTLARQREEKDSTLIKIKKTLGSPQNQQVSNLLDHFKVEFDKKLLLDCRLSMEQFMAEERQRKAGDDASAPGRD